MTAAARPAILVGRRAGDAHRDLLWDYCYRRWCGQLDWRVFEGHHGGDGDPLEEGPFCLSVAFNRAAARADELGYRWDVALLVGADWVAGTAAQVVEAADCALECDSLYFAHDATLVTTPAYAARALDDDDPARSLPDAPGALQEPRDAPEGTWHPRTFSGVVAVPRSLWDDVGGFDERFVGWGGEDLAFWSACCAARGGFDRVAGSVAHLWHPSDRADREDGSAYPANDELMRRYLAHKWDAGDMAGILREPGGPLAVRAA